MIHPNIRQILYFSVIVSGVTSCRSGHYGPKCSKRCHCLDRRPCNTVTGACGTCDIRYTGTDCQTTCKINRWLMNGSCSGVCKCVNTYMCKVTDGRCMDGKCDKGNDGTECINFCERCEKRCHCAYHINCNSHTGRCPSDECSPRYTGPTCQKTCAYGFYFVDDQCNGKCNCNIAIYCRVSDGTCIYGGCKPGWKYSKCDHMCNPGRFGIDCKFRCHCKNDDICLRDTGVCPSGCSARFMGNSCILTCNDGIYATEVTADMWFIGKYKEYVCNRQCRCKNDEICAVKDGQCIPTVGFTAVIQSTSSAVPASTNSIDCRIGRYRLNGMCKGVCHCKEASMCRTTDGKCMEGGCQSGWKGSSCDKECSNSEYGPNCWGKCTCRPGLICNPIHGCRKPCDVRHSGLNCNITCLKGKFMKYGECNGSCRCRDNSMCNVTSGACIDGRCARGWWNKQCSRKCLYGRFGLNCRSICHCKYKKPCHHITGSCRHGCAQGYSGNTCQYKEHVKVSMVTNTMMIGVGVSGGLCLMVIAIGLCSRSSSCCRRKPRNLDGIQSEASQPPPYISRISLPELPSHLRGGNGISSSPQRAYRPQRVLDLWATRESCSDAVGSMRPGGQYNDSELPPIYYSRETIATDSGQSNTARQNPRPTNSSIVSTQTMDACSVSSISQSSEQTSNDIRAQDDSMASGSTRRQTDVPLPKHNSSKQTRNNHRHRVDLISSRTRERRRS